MTEHRTTNRPLSRRPPDSRDRPPVLSIPQGHALGAWQAAHDRVDPVAADIRPCTACDVDRMLAVINAAAVAYAGVIPTDCYRSPYMTAAELCREMTAGVRFCGCFEIQKDPGVDESAAAGLLGLMGIQDSGDVTLIRHAYVLPAHQRRGVGSRLLAHLMGVAQLGDRPCRPVFVGTWTGAVWAIRFYERHGFRLVTTGEKDRLLRRYWHVPDRQAETSVVLRYELGDEKSDSAAQRQ